MKTPGVKTVTSVVGFSLLSTVYNTYSAFFFANLKPWSERTTPEESYAAINAHLASELGKIPEGRAFAFAPPSIPGVGASGGFTFVLEDRAGRDVSFLAQNVAKFMDAARQRKELSKGHHDDLPSLGAPGLHQGSTATRCSSRAWPPRPTSTGRCSATWAAPSSTTSTASAASGRSMSRPRASTATARTGSAATTSATATGPWCRCRP